ncbi:hypothetical protein [Cyclobacterium qasimii]|uniref:Uncharacterized protein n=2 Tax=Cyclobacterium qasimii TaxID=1350429 RepID=S7VC81_9BACT|nr:hypothetical protein [Cyclobacterium qasimii]EPR67591.1 hypothetical protein ADICYQ_3379 [Cyclobacterium qasimii M12-11B]GEO20914.1 hypothetical protein CQA01_14480 [Cyclobacterium qasimii]
MFRFWLLILISAFFTSCNLASKDKIHVVGAENSDLIQWLEGEGYTFEFHSETMSAIDNMEKGATLMVLSTEYPKKRVAVPEGFFTAAQQKDIKFYLEYPEDFEGLESNGEVLKTRLERAVVVSDEFGAELSRMKILGINDCHVIPAEVSDPLLVVAKVAGLDSAVYGLEGVPAYPLLFKKDQGFIALSKLSDFAKGRFGPEAHWKILWSHIISELTGDSTFSYNSWPRYVEPAFNATETLSRTDKMNSVRNGVDWFEKGKFYIAEEWKDYWLKYQGNGTNPIGPPVPEKYSSGDGSEGLLEGHSSNIFYDGTQQYRYWIRADVQGEAAYALAAAANLLEEPSYNIKAENLVKFLYRENLTNGPRNDPDSAAYGLIGWSNTHPFVYYGDDNARAILGVLGAMAHMQKEDWNEEMTEAILANFRTTGKNGFRSNRLNNTNLHQLGWKHYWNQETINPAPHFESWMWANYLWLYDKTGYEPLLTKAKKGIEITMEGYPQDWLWTNGIQQERARMILPLAWLVKVEDTPEHREWLDRIVSKLLENQVESGAIREELGGADKGRYGRTSSNQEYGLHEAPLIFENGDPIADMLYTSNFAFFSLNEAAHATNNPEYFEALEKLSDFMTRIQVKSDTIKDLDGAWFRAFDYERWEYWASNADAGWGAWGTLTGWTQSWIVATQVLVLQDQSYWELTKNSKIGDSFDEKSSLMLEEYK